MANLRCRWRLLNPELLARIDIMHIEINKSPNRNRSSRTCQTRNIIVLWSWNQTLRYIEVDEARAGTYQAYKIPSMAKNVGETAGFAFAIIINNQLILHQKSENEIENSNFTCAVEVGWIKIGNRNILKIYYVALLLIIITLLSVGDTKMLYGDIRIAENCSDILKYRLRPSWSSSRHL